MKEWRIVEWWDIQFAARFKPYGDGPAADALVIDWELFRIANDDGPNGNLLFEAPDSVFPAADGTPDMNVAVVYASGSTKWDGCSNFEFPEHWCMKHTCDRDGLANIGVALGRIYDVAFEMMPRADR